MANPNKTEKSSQEMDNLSFDATYNINGVELMGHDGQNIQRMNADSLNIKVTESGGSIYVGISAPGTIEGTAGWQCKKITESSGTTVVQYADGNANFDNTATDLTAHSYS